VSNVDAEVPNFTALLLSMLSYNPLVDEDSTVVPTTTYQDYKIDKDPPLLQHMSSSAAVLAQASSQEYHHIWLVAGPAGSGKTTVAEHIGAALGIPHLEGDLVRSNFTDARGTAATDRRF
jgi:2-phosphoglycerate kinase